MTRMIRCAQYLQKQAYQCGVNRHNSDELHRELERMQISARKLGRDFHAKIMWAKQYGLVPKKRPAVVSAAASPAASAAASRGNGTSAAPEKKVRTGKDSDEKKKKVAKSPPTTPTRARTGGVASPLPASSSPGAPSTHTASSPRTLQGSPGSWSTASTLRMPLPQPATSSRVASPTPSKDSVDSVGEGSRGES